MSRENTLRLSILLLAAVLRLWMITSTPPGLTHDEADHGLSAWGVVQGERPLYFSVGYGREPLYDYATAGLMTFLGPTYLAGRLTAIFFSLLLMAATYALVKKLFSSQVALLTLAGLAVGFWPLMVARQGLRTITMPFFFVLAVYFWIRGTGDGERTTGWGDFLWGGVFLGLTFYTYFPARIMWVLFPALLLLWLIRRPAFVRQVWRQTLLMLFAAGVVSTPLWLYLWQNPAAEQRLDQLTVPLDAAGEGDWGPLLENVMEGIRLIAFKGDTAWRYNIPERPLLSPFFALLFGLGLLLILWRLRPGGDRQDSALAKIPVPHLQLLLFWLLLALAPVFITGAYLANTRAVAVQPILYVFPALALTWMWSKADGRSPFAISAVVMLFAYTGLDTAQRYFIDWGQHPEVRVQYESTLVTAIDYLNQFGRGPAAISTTTPDRFHSQPVGLLTLTNPAVSLSWFNGQRALYVPADPEALLVYTGFAPLEPAFRTFLGETRPLETFPLAETDLDRPLEIYRLDGVAWQRRWGSDMSPSSSEVTFNDLLTFGGFGSNLSVLNPGDTLDLYQLWRPQGTPAADLVFFSQLLGPDGLPLAQDDRLDAPTGGWRAGDAFIQLHRLAIPADAPRGEFPLIIGVYQEGDLSRWPVTIDGRPAGDFVQIGTIFIGTPP